VTKELDTKQWPCSLPGGEGQPTGSETGGTLLPERRFRTERVPRAGDWFQWLLKASCVVFLLEFWRSLLPSGFLYDPGLL
jgi:hypothetical protein